MKVSRNFALVLIAILAFAAGRFDLLESEVSVAHARQADPDRSPDRRGVEEMEMDEESRAWVEAGRPGEHHKVLNVLVGKWETNVRFWPEPGSEPVVFPGTLTRKWVLDDRFVYGEVEGQGPMGAFKGIEYIGYNNVDGRYEMVWMENMSTSIYKEGVTYNPETKVMTSRGEHRNPATGQVITTWSEFDLSNRDRHTVVGYTVDENGRPFKSIEAVFERTQ